MNSRIKCTCGWSWNKSDSSKKDMYICHECGRDNSNNMKNGGWLDNYNDSETSAPEGFEGEGYSNVGRDYSPAWGGQFEDGGEIPMAQNGNRATRADSLAVYNNAKKVEDYYKKSGKYKQLVNTTGIFPGVFKDNDEAVKLFNKYNKTGTSVPLKSGKKGVIKIPESIYRKDIDKNKYLQRELETGILDTRSPIQLFDKRITPTMKSNYINTKAGDVLINDVVGLMGYDPLSVMPFDIVPPELQEERIRKYGTSGVPQSVLNLHPEWVTKPTTTKKTTKPSNTGWIPLTKEIAKGRYEGDLKNMVYRKKADGSYDITYQAPPDQAPVEVLRQPVQSIQNTLQPIEIQNAGLNKETELPQIRQQVRQPEYYDVEDYTQGSTNYISGQTNYRTDDLSTLSQQTPNNTRKIVPHYAIGGKLKSNIPVIEDAGGYNEDSIWVPDWEAMTAQAKKLGAKKVKTKHGSLIVFDDNWKIIGVDDNPDAMQMGGSVYPVNYIPEAQTGGSLPGATGHIYARYEQGGDIDFSYPRTKGIPSNGPYAKKTKASAQNGTEMKFYQEGLDWKPKSISKNGSIVKDDNGYWNPENWDGPVEIGSNNITMQDVPFDVLGISDEGDVKHMKANNPKNYKYKGKKVTEFRMAQNGMRQEQKGLQNLDDLVNFTNYNKPTKNWLNKYN